MASHHGLLPASKEVVLEIQLNKLINDFLFSGVENRNATAIGDAEAQDASRRVIHSSDDPHWNVENPMDNPACTSPENANITESLGNDPAHPSCGTDMSCVMSAVVDAQSPGNTPPKMLKGSKGMPSIQSKAACLPTSEDVRLDMPEQKSSSCNDDNPQHKNKRKVFRLSRAHSAAGSLFCFAMERQEQCGEKKEEERKTNQERGSIKLTRIGSLPCHSKLHSEVEKEVKHTCGKPPRPPRSSSVKSACPLLSRHASADAIFVLHSTSRRARLERRKKLAASSSSNASIWALIFTFCFAMAMIGEGFWSQSSAILAVDANINSTAAHNNHLNLNTLPLSPKKTTQNNLHVSSQLEKEMQMREFWISKGLDPS